MNRDRPILLLGKMWTDAHPRESMQLNQLFDVRRFDVLNAAQSIRELKEVVVDATVMRLDWLDVMAPFVRTLEETGTPILHVIASQQVTSDFPEERLKEIGVCGLITETDDMTSVAGAIRRIIENCRCTPGNSAFSSRSATMAKAFRRVEADEVDKRIVALVAEGFSNEEIAKAIFFSVNTVRNRLSEIMKATDLRNRTELALAWRRFSVDKDLQTTKF